MFEIGKTYRDEKIPTKTRWFYSVSGIGRDAAYVIVASFLLIFLQEASVLSTDLKEYTAMMGVLTGLIIGYRIFDGLNDPFMGVIIEKTHFKLGKYKPWIFIGSLTNIVCILALFCAPAAFPSWCHGWAYVGWFAVFYLLWGMTFTINDISFWGMLPSMSSDEKERAKVTSLVLIFSYAGSFIVATLMPILTQNNVLGNKAYWIMGIVIGTLFVISQTMVFLFCKEHKRDENPKAKKETVKFSDMITVLKQNDQVRFMILALFCYFFSQSIMNSLMQNVFYITIGYNSGKTMMTIFNAVNNLSMIVPMFFLPHILKKHARMSVFKLAYGVMIIGLLIFFFYGMPIGNGNYLSPAPFIIGTDGIRVLNVSYAVIYSILTAVIFLSQGISYGVIIIMMSNCIEYNEYKTGSRKEAVIFALRPLTTKLATSVQQGVTTGALLSTGVMAIMNEVSKINGQSGLSDTEKAIALDKAVSAAQQSQIWGLKIWCVIVPVVLASICWFLLTKYYKIDETYYKKMCVEINKRNSK